MGVDTPLFIFSLVDGAALLFLVVYFWVLPELVANCVVTALLLLTGHWIIFILNLPQTAWVLYKIFAKPKGNIGVFDPAEIHNRNTLRNHTRECMAKLGFHLVFFFIYLYCMIIALIKGEVS